MTGVHFLLTYQCTQACDHCFVFGSPDAPGTFSLEGVRSALAQIARLKSVDTVYFEGGEPFLFYPLLLESVRAAKRAGFKAGIVTNGYFATTLEDAKMWLAPLAGLGVENLTLSDDDIHSPAYPDTPAAIALEAAKALAMPTLVIKVQRPVLRADGAVIESSGVMFRGRAAEKMAQGMPLRPWETMTRCPGENLASPGRVHLDAYGNVHLCQGLLMGNILRTPFERLVSVREARARPVTGALIEGGPALLARRHSYGEDALSECHLCYRTRKRLAGKFPDELGPLQVYGL